MHLIEPCCSQKNLRELRYTIKDGGTAQFKGYGDLSLAELLPPLVNHYNGTEMLIAAPMLPDQAAEAIDKWMKLTWARMDGQGSIWRIQHLTIVAKLEKEKSDYIFTWLKNKPFGDRLTLINIEQEDTAILLPDFAITGPVNMRYGNNFVATATTMPEKIKELWERFRNYEGGARNDEITAHGEHSETLATEGTQESWDAEKKKAATKKKRASKPKK